jgi:hypothetical protein
LLLVLQNTDLLLLKAAEIYVPTLIISGQDLVLGTGQKSLLLPNGKYLEIKMQLIFSLATEREVHLSSIQYLLENS